MSTEKYDIRQVGPAEFELLVPLMKDCFGLTVDIDYFRWKYTQNPAGDFIGFIAVEKETGEVGAYYGAIPELYMVKGREQVIYQSCDTMTHSKHRRRGLFQLLALHCYDQMQQQGLLQVYGFGGAQSTPGFIKFGWSQLFELILVFYPRQLGILRLPGSKKGQVSEVTDLDSIAGLVQQSNDHSPIHAAKKLTHFRWRINNPMHDYKVLGYKNAGGQVTGYLVYYRNEDKLFVFDWGFVERAAEHRLFGTLKNMVAKDKTLKGLVSMTKPGGQAYKTMRRNGFIYNPFKKGPLTERTPFIVYMKGEKAAGLETGADWEPGPYDHDAM
jgi:hypothetical protein